MRALLAGLFVFGSMLGTVALIGDLYPDGRWPWWPAPLIICVMFGSMLLSLFIFNRPGFRPGLAPMDLEDRIAELDGKGLLVRQSFQALRAFSVEETEDEGSTYFIELDNHNVLVLTGQYLYEFEPTTDDPELDQARKFPCTEFEILRHKQAGYVLDIKCNGTVLEPELTGPYTKAEIRRGVPEDGDIITGRDYDAIKQERASG